MMFFQCLFKSVLVFSPEAVSFSVLGDKVWLFPGFVRDVLKYLQLTASLISIKLNQAAILGCSTSPWCIMEPESIGFMVDVIQAVSMSTHLLLTTVQLHLRTPLYTVSTVRSRRRDSPTQSLFTVQKNKDNLTACDRKGQSFHWPYTSCQWKLRCYFFKCNRALSLWEMQVDTVTQTEGKGKCISQPEYSG